MVIESLGLPMFEDIETLAEETRLTEKLLFIKNFISLKKMEHQEK